MFPNALSTNFFGNDNPYRNSMRSMDQMMNSVFSSFPDPLAGMMMPFGGGNMFGNFDSLMNNMSNMNNMMANSNSSQSYCTFMSYSTGGTNGQELFKASSSTITGPGGIKETKKSISDSRTGVKKLAIGHHIGDRAHIIERQQNMYSGDREDNEEYINLNDDEAEEFNNEWRNKAQNLNSHRNRYTPYTHRAQNSSSKLKALPSSTSRTSDVLAIEGPHEQGRKRSAKQKTPKKIQQYPR